MRAQLLLAGPCEQIAHERSLSRHGFGLDARDVRRARASFHRRMERCVEIVKVSDVRLDLTQKKRKIMLTDRVRPGPAHHQTAAGEATACGHVPDLLFCVESIELTVEAVTYLAHGSEIRHARAPAH